MAVANRLILVLLLLVGCHSPKTGFKIATAGDPQTLDPRLAREIYSVNQAHLLYQGLFRKNLSGETVPALAESYSTDGKSYRIILRPCLWSDGSPLTAHDVVRSWQEVLDNPLAPFAYQLEEMERFSAESDRVLLVDLKYPDFNFVELLATNSFFPVRGSYYCGPFQLEEWIPHRHLILKKNPHYWDAEHIGVERVIFEKIHDEVALQLFLRGELDWVGAPLGSLPLNAMETLQPVSTPALATRFLRLNTERVPRFTRRALSSSIDREALVRLISKYDEKVAQSFLPALFDLGVESQVDDRAALDDTLELLYIQSEVNHLLAQYLEQEWKRELGLKVLLKPANPQVFYELLSERNYEVAIGTWYACSWDPLHFLEFLKGENETGWVDALFTSLLDQIALETDVERRKELLRQAEKRLQEEAPIVSLYHPSLLHLTNSEYESIRINPLGILVF